MKLLLAVLSALLVFAVMPVSRAEPVTILALGDSLTAGYGLAPSAAFPAKLEAALRGKGHDVVVLNAGVSGDTAAQGAARLDWSLSADVDAVIVELGANDALRGLDPAQTEVALQSILDRLAAKSLPVLLSGMRAPPNLGGDYAAAFEGMFARLGALPDVITYPFFLEGVAGHPTLNQQDGLHPTEAGIDVIVAGILPHVEDLLSRTRQ